MDKKRIRDQLNSSIKAMGEYINTHQIAIKQCKLDVADFEKQIKDLETKGDFDWICKGVKYWFNSSDGGRCAQRWHDDIFDKAHLKELNVYQTEELCRMGHIRDVIARTKGDWDGVGEFFYVWNGVRTAKSFATNRTLLFNNPKFQTAESCEIFWTEERKEAQKHFNTYK